MNQFYLDIDRRPGAIASNTYEAIVKINKELQSRIMLQDSEIVNLKTTIDDLRKMIRFQDEAISGYSKKLIAFNDIDKKLEETTGELIVQKRLAASYENKNSSLISQNSLLNEKLKNLKKEASKNDNDVIKDTFSKNQKVDLKNKTTDSSEEVING